MFRFEWAVNRFAGGASGSHGRWLADAPWPKIEPSTPPRQPGGIAMTIGGPRHDHACARGRRRASVRRSTAPPRGAARRVPPLVVRPRRLVLERRDKSAHKIDPLGRTRHPATGIRRRLGTTRDEHGPVGVSPGSSMQLRACRRLDNPYARAAALFVRCNTAPKRAIVHRTDYVHPGPDRQCAYHTSPPARLAISARAAIMPSRHGSTGAGARTGRASVSSRGIPLHVDRSVREGGRAKRAALAYACAPDVGRSQAERGV